VPLYGNKNLYQRFERFLDVLATKEGSLDQKMLLGVIRAGWFGFSKL
jgi:hypothetical protein